MYPPNINHNNTPLGDEVSFIPSILRRKMIRSEFIHEAPAHDFFYHCADVWEIWFIVEGWSAIWADYAVKFVPCLLNYFSTA